MGAENSLSYSLNPAAGPAADPRMLEQGFKHLGGDSYYRRPPAAGPAPAPVQTEFSFAPRTAPSANALKTAAQLAMEVPPPPVSSANVLPNSQITLGEWARGGFPSRMYPLWDATGAANVRAALPYQAMATGQLNLGPEAVQRYGYGYWDSKTGFGPQPRPSGYTPGQYGGGTTPGVRPSVIAPSDIPAGSGQVAGEAAEAGGMGARISRALAPIGEALAPVGKALAPVGRALAPLAPIARGLGTAAAYAAPVMNIYENYQNFSDPNRIRNFNDSLKDKSVLGRAWAGLTNPMTAISGASLAAQEAMGFDPTGQLAKQAEAKRAAEENAANRSVPSTMTVGAPSTDSFSITVPKATDKTPLQIGPANTSPSMAVPSKPAASAPATAAPVKPAGYQPPTAEEMARFRRETGTAFSSQSINDKLSLERMRAGEETFDTKQANAYRKANPNYRPGQYVKGYKP